MIKESFEIGEKVELWNTKRFTPGMIGTIKDIEIYLLDTFYLVDFGIDVSKYTHSGAYTTQMLVPSRYLKKYKPKEINTFNDFKTLINLALDTNDEEWFRELCQKKEM